MLVELGKSENIDGCIIPNCKVTSIGDVFAMTNDVSTFEEVTKRVVNRSRSC